MHRYNVLNDEGHTEILEVAAESEVGFHIQISVTDSPEPRVYRDFITRSLFETLVKTGTLEPLGPSARAG